MNVKATGEIRVSAVVLRDTEGRVLHVRKRGTSTLMLPGGKPEFGETAAQTAVREIHEELGITLHPARLQELGEFRAAAANEAGFDVVADVFEHPYVAGARVRAEIEQIAWVHPTEIREDMAPLNTEHVFPLLLEKDRAADGSSTPPEPPRDSDEHARARLKSTRLTTNTRARNSDEHAREHEHAREY